MKLFNRIILSALIVTTPALADSDGSSTVMPLASKKGVEQCIDRWESAGEFVEEETLKTNGQMLYNSTSPDTRLGAMVVEGMFEDFSVLSLINVAPTEKGKCDAT